MDEIMAVYKAYVGTGMIAALFLCGVIYLMLTEKKQNIRIMFVYMPVLVLLFFFNPLTAKLVGAMADDEIYYRILWLLPVVPVLALTAVRLLERTGRKYRLAFGGALGGIIVLSGSLVYTSPYFHRAENIYHVPQNVVDICDAIEVEGREVMAAFPPEFLQYVRQYSPVVCMPYGREQLVERWGFYDELYLEMTADEIDVQRVAQLAREELCHYVVVHEGRILKGNFEACGYEVFDVIDGYVIYVDNSIYRGL